MWTTARSLSSSYMRRPCPQPCRSGPTIARSRMQVKPRYEQTIPWCRRLRGAASFRLARTYGEARAATLGRADLDAVAQQPDRAAHDEQADAQAVAARGVDAVEGL